MSKRNDLFRFSRLSSVAISLLFILLLLNSAHQLYYTAKVAVNYKAMKKAAVREQDYVYFETLLMKTIKENPGQDIVVASSDKYYPLLASMHGQKGIANPYDLDSHIAIVKRPAVLFTVIFAPEKHRYSNYLKNRNVKLVDEVAGSEIYMQSIDPSP